MKNQFADAIWPEAELGQLVQSLAARTALQPRPCAPPSVSVAHLDQWFETVSRQLGLESEPVTLYGAGVPQALRAAAPAVVRVAGGFVGLLGMRRGMLQFLTPALGVLRGRPEDLAELLCRPHEELHRAGLETLLDGCAIHGPAKERALAAMARARCAAQPIGTLWQLRVSPGAGFAQQVRQAGLFQRVAIFAASHIFEYSLWLAAWWVVGRGALAGRLDRGWLAAWCLMLLTIIPFRLLTTWSQGVLAVGLGGLLRQRLLFGALKLEPEEIRSEGVGQLLGRTIEAEMVESLALSGGLSSVLALFESALAAVVLLQGSGGVLQAAVFVAWIFLTLFAAWRGYVRRSTWTADRLAMTHDLVERMNGHRTRLAQEDPAQWHNAEDSALEQYLESSRRLDAQTARLSGLLPRGWLVVAVAALAPAFLAVNPSQSGLAVAIGGTLLAWQSLRRLASGMSQLGGAAISWRLVAPLFHAASRPENVGISAAADPDGATVVDARDLVFRYPNRVEPVLRGANLKLLRGDRVLLEGESGGGKSTLSALLTGLREPQSGLLLAGGLDRRTLGDSAWRRRVAAAPQFHENHVLAATFAFNLLMGSVWPPSYADLADAQSVCRELGLGPLLDRMPGGIMQMVGETGWQLSQGERSRLFLARAILQNAELVVLDESFAALDPENLRQCLECVLRRAKTLLVVAHP